MGFFKKIEARKKFQNTYKIFVQELIENHDLKQEFFEDSNKSIYNNVNKFQSFSIKIGKSLFSQKKYDIAENFYEKVIENCKNHQIWDDISLKKLVTKLELQIGNSYSKRNMYKEAELFFLKSIKILEVYEDWKEIGKIYFKIGKNFFQQEKYDKARKYVEKTFEYNKLTNNKVGIAIGNMQMGFICFKQRKSNEALEFFNTSMDIDAENGSWAHIAITLTTIGNYFSKKGEIEKSIYYYLDSINFYEKVQEFNEIKITWLNLGNLYSHQRKFEDAILSYKKSIEYQKKDGNLDRIAETHVKIAKVYSKKKDNNNAMKWYQKAIFLHEKDEKWEDIAYCNLNVGKINESYSYFNEAIKNYEYVIENSKKMNNFHRIASIYKIIGDIYYQQGKYDEAIKQYEKGIEYNEKDNNFEGISILNTKIGDIFLQQRKLNEAIEQYEKGVEYNEKINNFKGIAILNTKIGNQFSKQRKFDEAIERYKKAIENDEKMKNFRGVAILNTKIGDILFQQRKFDEALERYKKAIENEEKMNNFHGKALINTKIGNLLTYTGNNNEALKYYIIAIRFNDLAEDWINCARTCITIGDNLKDQELFQESFEYYKLASEYDHKTNNFNGKAISNIKIGNLFAHSGKKIKALEYYEAAIDCNLKSGNRNQAYRIKIDVASIFRRKNDWLKSLNIYNELTEYYKEENWEDSQYFHIQALKCQARISESANNVERIIEIYSKIAQKYLQVFNNYHFANFYLFVKEIFEAELLSQKGEHTNCLKKLEELLIRFNLLFEDREKENFGYFSNLIKFRIKLVELYIKRENAYIFDNEGEFLKSKFFFQECATISESLFPPRFEKDNLLYKGISKFYLAHSKRVEFQNLLQDPNQDTKILIKILEEKILSLFYECKDIFHELNQELRKKYITYEILLLEGKLFELKNENSDAFFKYQKASEILTQIDEEKAEEFSLIYPAQLKETRIGVSIEKFFLHKPSPGSTFIEHCNNTDMGLKHRFIKISFENHLIFGSIEEDYVIKVKVKIDDEYFKHFGNEVFYLQCYETGQKRKISFEKDNQSQIIDFKLPAVKESSKKVFLFELFDEFDKIIRTKSLNFEYKKENNVDFKNEYLEIIREEFGKNMLLQIIPLIHSGNFIEIENSLDRIIYSTKIFEIRIFLDVLKKIVQGVNNYLEFQFRYTKRIFANIMQVDIHLLSPIEQEFFQRIKKDNISKILNQLNEFQKEEKKTHHIGNIHSLLFEIIELKIENAFKNHKFAITLQLTISFFEKLMNKILIEKYNLDYNKIIWENFEINFVAEYKKLFRQETMIPEGREIILRDKLEYEAAKCLLMLLNNDYLDFCQKNTKIINRIRQARNKSYLEHGIKPVDENTAKLCLELLKDIKNYPALYKSHTSFLKDHLEFLIKKFIDFIELNLISDKNFLEEKTMLEKQEKIPESTEIVEFTPLEEENENEINNPIVVFNKFWDKNNLYLKIKIQNNSENVITNINIILEQYPSMMTLLDNKVKSTHQLQPEGATWVPGFKLDVGNDYITGKISVSVNYFDHKNNHHSIRVNPIEISYIYPLLESREISKPEYEEKIHKMVYKVERIMLGEIPDFSLLMKEMINKMQEMNFAIVDLQKSTKEIWAYAKVQNKNDGIALETKIETVGNSNELILKILGENETKCSSLLQNVQQKLDSIGLSAEKKVIIDKLNLLIETPKELTSYFKRIISSNWPEEKKDQWAIVIQEIIEEWIVLKPKKWKKISQYLLNVLENAFKYGLSGLASEGLKLLFYWLI